MDLYLKIESEVQYDKTLTTKLPNELIGNIRDQIQNFSSSNIEKFVNDVEKYFIGGDDV